MCAVNRSNWSSTIYRPNRMRAVNRSGRGLSKAIGQDAAQANSFSSPLAARSKDLLGVEVGEDFLALFKGVAQRNIFHEETEGLAAAAGLASGNAALFEKNACSDHAGRRVDAVDP